MTGTEICPKCGTHFDGVWWRNLQDERETEFEKYLDGFDDDYLASNVKRLILSKHNASIADERKKSEQAELELETFYKNQLNKQLATAVEALEEALAEIAACAKDCMTEGQAMKWLEHNETYWKGKETLAKLGEGK